MPAPKKTTDPTGPDVAGGVAGEPTIDAEVVTVAGDGGEPVIDAEIMTGTVEIRDALHAKLRQDVDPESRGLALHPAIVSLNRYLEQKLQPVDEAQQAVADIIAQVLSATSLDEVLSNAEAIGLREMMDEPIIIHAWKAQRSDYEEGQDYYAVMDIERPGKGWRGPVTCGAASVLAQLARMSQLDELPATVVCVKATKKATKRGYWPIRLAAVPTVKVG